MCIRDRVYVTMIAATGVFFIMTMGGLDFSQGSILGIASIVVCMLSKISIPLASVGGIAAGAAIGAINGYFYVCRKIKSFIVTICTMFLFRGFIKYLTPDVYKRQGYHLREHPLGVPERQNRERHRQQHRAPE